MVKVLSLWFQHCFIPLPCSLSKRLLEGDFIDIYLTTFFGVRKFKNTWAIRVIFFLKLVKIEYKFIKCQKKNWKNIFRFWAKGIRKCSNKLPLLRTEYLLSAVNGLTNSPKIGNITQRNFFNLNWFYRY